MFEEKKVPTSLWARAQNINTQEVLLAKEIAAFQSECVHSFVGVMGYDPAYSPRVDEPGKGTEVIKYFHCSKCCFDKPIGHPFSTCWKCGGKMVLDHQEQYGMDRVQIHKCCNCGHEYDTT